ncbi:MAG: hypothetical protein FWF65_08640, partial [Bacteroidetes bacterium]|nr:hypothetical protein [Bacteroidota bacterium]
MKETDKILKEMFAESRQQLAETDKQMKETDKRLEKMFAENRQQLAETGQQMKETDKILKEMFAESRQQLAETDKQMKETDKRLKEMFAENRQQLAETDKQMKETDKRLEKMFAENRQQFKETKEILKKNSEETRAYLNELRQHSEETKAYFKELGQHSEETKAYFKELGQRSEETRAYFKELGQHLGGIANSNGDMAEEYFFNTLKRDKTFVNEKFDKIKRNLVYGEDIDQPALECDILLFNGKSAAIIEVKYKAKPDNVRIEKLIARVEAFRVYNNEYKNHNIYLGVAAMSFSKKLAQELHRAGIATIHQMGKKIVVYDKNVKAF